MTDFDLTCAIHDLTMAVYELAAAMQGKAGGVHLTAPLPAVMPPLAPGAQRGSAQPLSAAELAELQERKREKARKYTRDWLARKKAGRAALSPEAEAEAKREQSRAQYDAVLAREAAKARIRTKAEADPYAGFSPAERQRRIDEAAARAEEKRREAYLAWEKAAEPEPVERVAAREEAQSSLIEAAVALPAPDTAIADAIIEANKAKPPPHIGQSNAPRVAAPQPKTRMEALMRVSMALKAEATGYQGEPPAVDLQQVIEWGAPRGIAVKSWDDLPAINARREMLGLVRYARKFHTRGVQAR